MNPYLYGEFYIIMQIRGGKLKMRVHSSNMSPFVEYYFY